MYFSEKKDVGSKKSIYTFFNSENEFPEGKHIWISWGESETVLLYLNTLRPFSLSPLDI